MTKTVSRCYDCGANPSGTSPRIRYAEVSRCRLSTLTPVRSPVLHFAPPHSSYRFLHYGGGSIIWVKVLRLMETEIVGWPLDLVSLGSPKTPPPHKPRAVESGPVRLVERTLHRPHTVRKSKKTEQGTTSYFLRAGPWRCRARAVSVAQ